MVLTASSTCQGFFLALWGDGASINEGLENLMVFTLEHHFELLPAGLAVINLFGIDVEGL